MLVVPQPVGTYLRGEVVQQRVLPQQPLGRVGGAPARGHPRRTVHRRHVHHGAEAHRLLRQRLEESARAPPHLERGISTGVLNE